jgi:hypothetical protein
MNYVAEVKIMTVVVFAMKLLLFSTFRYYKSCCAAVSFADEPQCIYSLLEVLSNHVNITHRGQKDLISYIIKVF